MKNMDVYLKPFLDELKVLWNEGCIVQNMSKPTMDEFQVKAILMWTIHDYLGLRFCSSIFTFHTNASRVYS
jgi:hypothetical protein